MKKIKFSLLLLFITTALALNAQVIAPEDAIKKVIEDETHLYNQRDYDAWAATWAHNDNVLWSLAGPNTNLEYRGWDDWSAQTKEYFMENPEPVETYQKKTNYNFTVNGDMAFVTFLEDGNMSSRVVVREEGKWKLQQVGIVQTKAYEAQKQMKALHGLTGVWQLDPATVELSDEEWTLLDVHCKVKETTTGLKMYLTSDWKNDKGFEGTWKDSYMIARDSESGMLGAMVSTEGPWGTSVHAGECYVKDDYVKIIAKKLGKETSMKHKIMKKDDNHVDMQLVFMNAEGEKEWEMKFTLVKDQESSLAMN